MARHDPAVLDSATLASRLHDLVGDERRAQVDFLLHLDEFDRRRAFLPLGFGSLWDYCLKALHLREGAAGRRIGAMRVLRRFPRLEAPLRDGRLCLSTASLLGQILTNENLDELLGRAAFLTKAEVEQLVVSIRPKVAPREGIRMLAAPTPPAAGLALVAPERSTQKFLPSSETDAPVRAPVTGRDEGDVPALSVAPGDVERPQEPERRAEVEAVGRDRWSLRVTLDVALKEEIETLRVLLSHKVPNGELREILREAVRCGIEKHGKRKGAIPPAREVTRAEDACAPAAPRAVSASVRRQVWARDGGRCTFVAEDGRRCESRWQLELDHVDPAARGGPPTAANLRLRCRSHNILHAVTVYGRERMDRFRRETRGPRAGESAIAGESSTGGPSS